MFLRSNEQDGSSISALEKMMLNLEEIMGSEEYGFENTEELRLAIMTWGINLFGEPQETDTIESQAYYTRSLWEAAELLKASTISSLADQRNVHWQERQEIERKIFHASQLYFLETKNNYGTSQLVMLSRSVPRLLSIQKVLMDKES